MAEESVFREVITFFNKIGVYDIILPFILVFTIVFAILEKTKVLGTEEIGDKKWTKKNLNAAVAFVVSFIVVASTKLVSVINEVMANVVLLAILAISFMMLVGTFYGSKEYEIDKDSNWMKFFMIAMFVGIVLIFMNALGWLAPFWYYLTKRWDDTTWVASLILIAIVVGFIFFVVSEKDKNGDKKKKNDKK